MHEDIAPIVPNQESKTLGFVKKLNAAGDPAGIFVRRHREFFRFADMSTRMRALMKSADFLLLPTFSDTFGYTAIEAMWMRKYVSPIICPSYLGYRPNDHGPGRFSMTFHTISPKKNRAISQSWPTA